MSKVLSGLLEIISGLLALDIASEILGDHIDHYTDHRLMSLNFPKFRLPKYRYLSICIALVIPLTIILHFYPANDKRIQISKIISSYNFFDGTSYYSDNNTPGFSPISDSAINALYNSSQIISYYKPYSALEENVNFKEIFKLHEDIEVSYPKLTIFPKYLKFYRDYLMDNYKKIADTFNDKPLTSEEEILEQNWYEYGGGSIYLKSIGYNFMVTRVIYSKVHAKNDPFMSYLGFLLLDKNFNHIEKSINFKYGPNTDNNKMINFPTLGIVPDTYFKKSNNRKDRYYGPEDPRILIKTNHYQFYHKEKFVKSVIYEEPIVIFNMMTDKAFKYKRLMHAYLPFQDKKVIFRIKNETPRIKEKNWEPFFNDDFKNIIKIQVDDINIIKEFENNKNQNQTTFDFDFDYKYTNGYIHFIYSIDSLSVLKCSLDDGICEYEYKIPQRPESIEERNMKDNKKASDFDIGNMRGGTPLLKLPDKFYASIERIKETKNDIKTTLQNYNVWVGFPRSHLNKCGCGAVTYRPSMMAITSLKGSSNYQIELISSSIDFNLDVLNWDGPGKLSCDAHQSVLIPNSIAYWDIKEIVENGYYGGNDYKDYMSIILSEADINNIVIHVRGLLNYLLEMEFFQKLLKLNRRLIVVIFILIFINVFLSSLFTSYFNDNRNSIHVTIDDDKPFLSINNDYKVHQYSPISPFLKNQLKYNPYELTIYTRPSFNFEWKFDYYLEKYTKFGRDVEIENCNTYLFKDSIQVSNDPKLILSNSHLKLFREQILLTDYSLILNDSFTRKNIPIPEDEQTLINNHWYQFAGSSVWLNQQNLYFMASRVVFTPTDRGGPTESFLALNLYDKNWKEISELKYFKYGPFTDQVYYVNAPSIFDSILFYFNMDVLKKKSGYYRFFGPEDPRVILKKTRYQFYYQDKLVKEVIYEEPMIIFNLLTDKEHGNRRLIHVFLPFQDKLIVLRKVDARLKRTEKNWSPFFKTGEINTIRVDIESPDAKISTTTKRHKNFKFSNGLVYFVYSIEPFKIIKCNLDNGKCRSVFDGKYDSKRKTLEKSFMRGGTNLIELPKKFISKVNEMIYNEENNLGDRNAALMRNYNLNLDLEIFKNYNIWIGFPRSNIKKCGCGFKTYRPSLQIMVSSKNKKKAEVFEINSISSSIDFDINILNWNTNQSSLSCDGLMNAFIPNSIAFWDIDEDNNEMDYMGMTLSEADYNTMVIHIKGLLRYILKLDFFQKKKDKESIDGKHEDITNPVRYLRNTKSLVDDFFLVQCALKSSYKYCVNYARNHSSNFNYTMFSNVTI
ncbi:glycosyltransferase family 91 protein [Ascoidea rubescens DSM 1968]|uniref:Glycosyltransferase family 91 protein n=1 Tax=Ascoidea rubescens DSM 1968 TaxID=1344418 RepID=A0A1D2VS86_9ASCO|nr:glycosyltransferase family 91 protein [Ascoidea rubescens DSM 1968]ODV64459.1 glycosyltransferase family 91 protein [Ascoidea rubescens DSM 1968]